MVNATEIEVTTGHLESRTQSVLVHGIGLAAFAFSGVHLWHLFAAFMPGLAAVLVVLMLDAFAWLLLDIDIRQLKANRPVPAARYAAYGILAFSTVVNASAGNTLGEAAAWAIPPLAFAFVKIFLRWVTVRNLRDTHGIRNGWWQRRLVERGRRHAARTVTAMVLDSRASRRRVRRALRTGALKPDDAVRLSGVIGSPVVHPLELGAIVGELGGTVTLTPGGTTRSTLPTPPEHHPEHNRGHGSEHATPGTPETVGTPAPTTDGRADGRQDGRGAGLPSGARNAADVEFGELVRLARGWRAARDADGLGAPSVRDLKTHYRAGNKTAADLLAAVWPDEHTTRHDGGHTTGTDAGPQEHTGEHEPEHDAGHTAGHGPGTARLHAVGQD